MVLAVELALAAVDKALDKEEVEPHDIKTTAAIKTTITMFLFILVEGDFWFFN
jgi:hypothetical protein